MPLNSDSEINEIVIAGGLSDQPDKETKEEFIAYEKNKHDFDGLIKFEKIKLLRIKSALEVEHLENETQNRLDRKIYANRIFNLIVGWIVAIILLIVAQGFHEIISFSVSDKVLMSIIGGTTINVLGVFVIVTKYLFNSGNGNKTKKPDKIAKNKKPTKPF